MIKQYPYKYEPGEEEDYQPLDYKKYQKFIGLFQHLKQFKESDKLTQIQYYLSLITCILKLCDFVLFRFLAEKNLRHWSLKR